MSPDRPADSVHMATRKKATTVLTPDISERRESPRLKLPKVEAEVVSAGLRATVLDVGFGGVSIESAHEFQVGEVHTLRSASSDKDTDVLRARVRHCRREHKGNEPQRYVTGLEFVDLWCPGDGSPVDEFISQVTRGIFKTTS